MSFKISLSYNPIPTEALSGVLDAYKDKHHQAIIDDFEKEICKITGSPYTVALNSGTSAIHLGLKLLGVGQGDLVICPTFTYIASVNPVLYLGAEPVFVDCEMQTWCMDPALLEEALSDLDGKGKKPKAIVVVYAYGMPGRIDELVAIAKKYEVPVLEDAAEALGSTSKGRHMGTVGEVGIISFNNNKIVTTYGGGALLVKTKEEYQKALFWATQSREDKPYYEHKEIGYNYRMGVLNAAMGLARLPSLEERMQRNRIQFQAIERVLATKEYHFQEELNGDCSNRWLVTAIRKDSNPLKMIELLARMGMEARPLWNPMHRQGAGKNRIQFLNGTADQLFETGVCLPPFLIKNKGWDIENIMSIFEEY